MGGDRSQTGEVKSTLRTRMARLFAFVTLDEQDVEMRRRIVMIHVISLVGIVNLFPLGVAAWIGGVPWLATFDLAFGTFLVANLVYLRRTGRYVQAAVVGVALGGALFLYLFATGGVEGSGHLWAYTFPLLASFLLGSRGGVIASASLLLPMLFVLAVPVRSCPYLFDYSIAFTSRFVPSFLVVLAYSYTFERLREGSHRSLFAKNAELAEAVSALREKERALELAQQRLEQRVRERTADLNQAHLDLQRSHDRFTTVVDSMDAWVYAADLDTYELLFMNRSMREKLSEARLGEPCHVAIFGEDAPCRDCPGRQLVELEGKPEELVTWEGWNPRTRRWYLHHARSARWVDGRTVRIQLTTDITKRRDAEEENATLQVELLQAQKMEALGALAGGVAHDLNNILSGVVGYPELLLMDLPDDSPLREPIARIKKSGENCARIVQDLLTLARRGVATSEPVDLNAVVRGYLESPEFAALCSRHPGVRVVTRLDPDVATITGSSHHLAKTLMNLVSNSAEAMPDGGEIVLTTRTLAAKVPIKGAMTIPPGDYAILSVADDGVGIPGTMVHRIFEPFFTTKIMGRSGTGLGMAVVWATVQDHAGHIDIRTERDRGTTMTIYFPAVDAPDGVVSADEDEETAKGRGERILVVDDVAEQRDLGQMILSRLDYRVETAAGGEAALERLRRGSADLLVLDMVMEPGIDGLETFRRAREIDPTIRAVITSGFAESDRVREAQRLGAGPYVKKPFLIREIAEAVRAELDRAPRIPTD